jgi:hypothetical protein
MIQSAPQLPDGVAASIPWIDTKKTGKWDNSGFVQDETAGSTTKVSE